MGAGFSSETGPWNTNNRSQITWQQGFGPTTRTPASFAFSNPAITPGQQIAFFPDFLGCDQKHYLTGQAYYFGFETVNFVYEVYQAQ